jgi:hypothetical protein
MKPMTISTISFACVFGGSLLAMILRTILPERHFAPEAQDVIKLGLGLIVTMNALVLGLLISTAKNSYDAKRALVAQMAADAILADRSLALYGSEAKEARLALHELVVGLIDQIQFLRGDLSRTSSSQFKAGAADFYQIVRRLSPRDYEQKALQAEVLRISTEVAQNPCIRASTGGQQRSGTISDRSDILASHPFHWLWPFCATKPDRAGRVMYLCVFRFSCALYGCRDGRSFHWHYGNLQRTS